MYKKHVDFKTPDRDTIIWRYFTLSKFLSLINDEQLFFSRIDKFFDAQEGILSDIDKLFLRKELPNVSSRLEKGIGCSFVNCWTVSNIEQYLMWSSYSSLDEGIAIKTTVGNLIDSLDPNDERPVFISDVVYIDHESQSTFKETGGLVNLLAPSFCKGKYFVQEKELRLVYIDFNLTLDDIIVSQKFRVSLDILIDEIWIAPKAGDWFVTVLNNEMLLHHINKPIRCSCIKTWDNINK